MRDCLTEAMDVEGLQAMLADIESGVIETYAKDTPQPSAFSHQILNAMPYAFLDDAPLEERRARAVTLRRALPDDARDLGALSPQAIARAEQAAWPVVRDAEELHDALLSLSVLPLTELFRCEGVASTEQLRGWFESLAGERRATEFTLGDGRAAWTCAERVHVVRALYAGASVTPPVTPPLLSPSTELRTGFDGLRTNGLGVDGLDANGVGVDGVSANGAGVDGVGADGINGDDGEDEALMALLRGWTESVGPFTEAGLAWTLGLSETLVRRGLAQLEAEGGVLRGRFTPGIAEEEFCNRRILARINRDTVAGLRQEVEPVPVATFIQFLFRWQHATVGTRVQHDGGLLQVVEQLQGFEAAAQVWETELLPLRMSAYDGTALDRLCWAARPSGDGSRGGPSTKSWRADARRWRARGRCRWGCGRTSTGCWTRAAGRRHARAARQGRRWPSFARGARPSLATSSRGRGGCPRRWRRRCGNWPQRGSSPPTGLARCGGSLPAQASG